MLRIAAAGGVARAYRATDLTPLAWSSSDKLPPAERVIGVDADQRQLVATDVKLGLLTLDLDLRRVRPVAAGARSGVAGPDGTLFSVDSMGNVTRWVRGRASRFRERLPPGVSTLLPGPQGSLFGVLSGSRGVTWLAETEAPVTVPLPNGPMVVSFWSDLVAVAADSGYVLWRPGARAPQFSRLRGGVRAVAFSPSGHRYFVGRERASLLAFDRFGGDELGSLPLPSGCRALRADRTGAWLLARSASGDSVTVLDPAALSIVATVAAPWGRDLPAVASATTLLVRRGADVVALDMGRNMAETGRVPGGAADLWIPVGWAPRSEAAPRAAVATAAAAAAADTAAVAATGDEGTILLQVSSSRNPAWATELAAKFKAQGLPAEVLSPSSPDDPYRVVLGPYPTRDAAEEAGRRLGVPSFIVTVRADSAR